jgi:hypothetical protein
MTPQARVERLVAAARRIADPTDALGADARQALPLSTGLSPEGVELALGECLETTPSQAELTALCASVEQAPAAHVLLSANVFTASHRAIALALAASPRVFVRASRREPEMTELLERGAPGAFELVPELSPQRGDVVFAYGSDETLRSVARTLPLGVAFRAHGTGFGLVVLELANRSSDAARLARDVARDVTLFDQRGCLSPRVVAVVGTAEETRTFGVALALALEESERGVPRGRMDSTEVAAAARYRDTVRFAAEIASAGRGWVGIDVRDAAPVVVPPVGRHVHVLRVTAPFSTLHALAPIVAALGMDASSNLCGAMNAIFPAARESLPGHMQRPPFDGAVDRRSWYFRDPEA